jgi:hypothetical protein
LSLPVLFVCHSRRESAFALPHVVARKAPTARSISAWGEAPGASPTQPARAESPLYPFLEATKSLSASKLPINQKQFNSLIPKEILWQ